MSTIVKGYFCWRCGVELSEFRLPVSRRDACGNCGAEVHACRQCDFYAARIANACREERAESVHDKEKANFCDYFKPKKNPYNATASGKTEAARSHAEALFSGGGEAAAADDPTQAAREELKRLFGEK
jgi:hypothetical protein